MTDMTDVETSRQQTETLDVEAVCLLEDFQPQYLLAMREYVQNSVARMLAVLSVLSQESKPNASKVLDVFNDVSATTALFVEYPEFVSLANSFVHAYTTQKGNDLVEKWMQELLLAAVPLATTPLHSDIITSVPAGQLVHFPLLEKTFLLRRKFSFSTLLNLAVSVHTEDPLFTTDYVLVPHKRNLTGTRRFLSTGQPSESGNEYSIFEHGQLPDIEGVARVDSALEIVGGLDLKLRASMLMLFKLLAVCPRAPEVRQAGSVSSLPGWIWQDVDPQAHHEDELAHLIVQLVHEFFHTKLNIVEKHILIWTTNGRVPLLYSPWKQRDRPIRQVVHALMTFSAGGVALKRFLEMSELSTPHMAQWAQDYWRENLEYASSTEQVLLNSAALSEQGERLVRSIVANFRTNVEGEIN